MSQATTPATGGPDPEPDRPTDLSTRYLGLELANPLVASASPATGDLDALLALQEAGIGAVVLPSLFEEQVEHEATLLAPDFLDETNPEAHDGYFPALDDYNTGPNAYLDLLDEAKRELSVPVVASLNGESDGGWTHYASVLEDSGADALELNVYHVAADVEATGAEVEDRYLRLVEHIRAQIAIPLAVKVGPFFSSPGNMAVRLAEAGADGLVLFNRFYQPDIDLDHLTVTPDLVLSDPAELRLILRWMAILHGRVDADLAATTGVHRSVDVVKAILAGADVVMMASALLRSGPDLVATVLAEVGQWFTERGYESVDQARGSVSQMAVPDPSAFERANYMRVLTSWGTGR
jgi:dihydroorotate dehydrogenase (fumarate)